MSTPEQILERLTDTQGRPYGARFFRVDFHFHTPSSEDARGKNKYNFNPYRQLQYPENDHSWDYAKQVRALQEGVFQEARQLASQMIDRFLEEKLSMVTITDHNGIGTIWPDSDRRAGRVMDLAAPTWYELIDDEAERRNQVLGRRAITILPGTEISTTGVHILAVFPPMQPRRKAHFLICDLLTEIGFAVSDFGRNPKVGRASVVHTLEHITRKGGIPIIAHIDGSDQSLLDLYEIKSGAMRNVLSDVNLKAVEVVKPSSLSRPQKHLKKPLSEWIDSVRRKADLDSIAYFQGSDAHDLKTIGKRFTYLKMSTPSFSGFENAIRSPSSRMRLSMLHTPPDSGHYIYGARIKSKYFGERFLRLNRHLNCIVGPKESGKSSLMQLFRKAVDERTDVEGEIDLFIDWREDGQSNLYCFSRHRDDISLHAIRSDNGDRVVERLDASDRSYTYLRPKFYRAERIEQLIASPDAMSDFLAKYFGRPTPDAAVKFEEAMALPSFLNDDPTPLITATIENGRYELALNTRWHEDKTKHVSLQKLSNSLRRLTIICIILISGRTGPLIIDEPGDHFDNQDIVNYLIPVVKYMKNFRQGLFATSNANLAINTDPENYISLALRGTKLSKFQSGFAIDHPGQREALIQLMEGNLTSYQKRGWRYTGVS